MKCPQVILILNLPTQFQSGSPAGATSLENTALSHRSLSPPKKKKQDEGNDIFCISRGNNIDYSFSRKTRFATNMLNTRFSLGRILAFSGRGGPEGSKGSM